MGSPSLRLRGWVNNFVVRNTGTLPWVGGPGVSNPVCLASRYFDRASGASLWSEGWRRCAWVVPLGQDSWMQGAYTNGDLEKGGVRQHGLVDVEFDMVHEGVTWFSSQPDVAPSPRWPLRLSDPARPTAPAHGAIFDLDTAVTLTATKPYDAGHAGDWTPAAYRFRLASDPATCTDPKVDIAVVASYTSPAGGAQQSWTVPASALTAGSTYYWCVSARNDDPVWGPMWTHWSTPRGFFFMTPAQAAALGDDGYAAWSEGVNNLLGNYVLTERDVAVTSVGPELAVTRTFNSLDVSDGPFGPGWTFNYDLDIEQADAGAVAVRYPDGRREIHTPNGSGGWTPPAGYTSDLSGAMGSGLTLRHGDGTVQSFDGTGRLTEIRDPQGRRLAFTFTSGALTRVTDVASGRWIELGWNAGRNRITEVRTDHPGTGPGVLVWRYGYDAGGRLLSACDPLSTA
jgi:YD repeat-containing protein